jgi:hypothetical protein
MAKCRIEDKAAVLQTWPVQQKASGAWDASLFRSDLTALLAHVGWTVTVDQAQQIEEVVDVPMF